MYCPKCGKENQEDARFCMHCGADLSGYKVEISPKIDVSPIINISMLEKPIIESQVGETFEKIVSLKDIREEMTELTQEAEQLLEIPLEELFTPERKKKRDKVLKIGRILYEEAQPSSDKKQKADAFTQVFEGIEKGITNLSVYDRQTLEKSVEFIDETHHEEFMKIKETKNTAEFVWVNTGNILSYLGEHDKAFRTFYKILEINPRSALALAGMGFTIIHQNWANRFIPFDKFYEFMQECKEAIKYFDRALQIDPQNETALVGKSYGSELRFNERMKYLDKALEINPKSTGTLCTKGFMLEYSAIEFVKRDHTTIDIKKFKSMLWEAMECYDKALRIDPNFTLALKGKERVLEALRT